MHEARAREPRAMSKRSLSQCYPSTFGYSGNNNGRCADVVLSETERCKKAEAELATLSARLKRQEKVHEKRVAAFKAKHVKFKAWARGILDERNAFATELNELHELHAPLLQTESASKAARQHVQRALKLAHPDRESKGAVLDRTALTRELTGLLGLVNEAAAHTPPHSPSH